MSWGGGVNRIPEMRHDECDKLVSFVDSLLSRVREMFGPEIVTDGDCDWIDVYQQLQEGRDTVQDLGTLIVRTLAALDD